MNDEVLNNSILIIGGMSIGKSTISELLGLELKMPIISVDAWKDEYLKNNSDYSFDMQLKIRKEKGYLAEVEYLIPFLNLSFYNILNNLDVPAIIDTSGLNTILLDKKIKNKIITYKNIVLLETNDINSLLNRRNIDKNSDLGKIYFKTLLNEKNNMLSTQNICIDNKSPQEIVFEILLNLRKNNKLL